MKLKRKLRKFRKRRKGEIFLFLFQILFMPCIYSQEIDSCTIYYYSFTSTSPVKLDEYAVQGLGTSTFLYGNYADSIFKSICTAVNFKAAKKTRVGKRSDTGDCRFVLQYFVKGVMKKMIVNNLGYAYFRGYLFKKFDVDVRKVISDIMNNISPSFINRKGV
jgi:hypothetical protein